MHSWSIIHVEFLNYFSSVKLFTGLWFSTYNSKVLLTSKYPSLPYNLISYLFISFFEGIPSNRFNSVVKVNQNYPFDFSSFQLSSEIKLFIEFKWRKVEF